MKCILSFLVAIILCCSTAEAATLYVNNTGSSQTYNSVTVSATCSDSTARASVTNNAPWCNFYRALRGTTSCTGSNSSEAATAGDTVIVFGNHSCAGTQVYDTPAFRAVNEGTNLTEGSGLLYFKCYSAGACRLSLSSSWSPIFGCFGTAGGGANDQAYIKWEGFETDPDSENGADTGAVIGKYTNNCIYERNKIYFNGVGNKHIVRKTDPAHGGHNGGDNLYQALTISSCTATTPTVCTISGGHHFDDQTGDRNLVYITGNSQLANCLYMGVNSTGTSLTSFSSSTDFMLVEAENGCGYSNGYAGLASVGTGGTMYHLNDDTNTSGIRLEWAQDVTVSNNDISGWMTGANVINGACILIYRTLNITYEHNKFDACGTGVHLKGNAVDGYYTGAGQIIRYNLFSNLSQYGLASGGDLQSTSDSGQCATHGLTAPCLRPLAYGSTLQAQGIGIVLHAGVFADSGNPAKVYQNIFYNIASQCVELRSVNSLNTPTNTYFVNNVCDQAPYFWRWPTSATVIASQGLKFWNNIVHRISNTVYDGSEASITDTMFNTVADFSFEHNRYSSGTYSRFASTSTGNKTAFSNWTTDLSNQDDDSPVSDTTDPSFVNADSRDYRLSGGSNALSDGVDILDLDGDLSTSDNVPLGAYITGSETIGITASGDPPPSPPPGTGNGMGSLTNIKRIRYTIPPR